MGKPDRFIGGTQFDEIISIYDTDSWLRNQLLTILEPIEVKIKTQIAHYLAIQYGPDCFYKQSIYENIKFYCEIFRAFENEIRRRQTDSVVIHHREKYEGKFPLWVLIEFFSFNTTSKFFKILPSNDRKHISNITFGMKDVYLTQWLHCISVLRNICAHYGYLYKREHTLKPRLMKEYKEVVPENGTLFALCIILKRLSSKGTWNLFIEEIYKREKICNTFRLSDYGFVSDWQKYLLD